MSHRPPASPAPLHLLDTSRTRPEGVADTLAGLGFAARLTVWAGRVWSRDKGAPEGSARVLAHAFRLARCRPALMPFDQLMLIALHGACRPVRFGPWPARQGANGDKPGDPASRAGAPSDTPAPGSPPFAGLTSDEARLLRVIAAFQDEAVIGGERALEAWLPPATARLAVDPALMLARSFGRAGLYVRPRGRVH